MDSEGFKLIKVCLIFFVCYKLWKNLMIFVLHYAFLLIMYVIYNISFTNTIIINWKMIDIPVSSCCFILLSVNSF